MINDKLSLDYLHHEFECTALLSLLVENMRSVLEEKLIGFEVNYTIVESF